MLNKKNIVIISVLLAISACIYGMQILIFKDVRNTEFYIFQDMAFIPISIAITTVVVGELLDINNKRDSRQKTRMLTSTFFSDIGFELMSMLALVSNIDEALLQTINDSDLSEQDKISAIKNSGFTVNADIGIYTIISDVIIASKTDILILSSNPMLYDHEYFSDLLWELLHLMDEFRLRGDYVKLTPNDLTELNSDFAQVLELLLINWVVNAKYLKETYPNFYKTITSFLDN
ncbi:hypothetical protein QU661_03980 [Mogibacterium neglectum]|uniref:hypothetical protein n=1 Tax=Mogibacterium neglectum TaxID=114528 RepID=UPI00272D48D5|nr:hypothetical protein [Mogibacterium neglectum]WLD77001.1 hypothetical protein QU661_03980 [Mogibacterium neglectum]